ncbi:uncharacterized protein BJ171DRAFT_568533, partial [Polychytrium aggregatum]|uniref:uncharacterized protein n=1 Tax=Polychytrium aggregatum TaxID=110093 RepID=UPI0022FF0574
MTSCRLPLRLLLQIRSLHRLRQPRWWMSRPPPLLFRTLPRRHPPQLPKSHCMSNSNSSSSSRHYRNSSYSNNPPRRCHCPSLALTPSCVLPRPLRLFSPVSPSILPSSPPPASSLPTLPSPAPLLPKLPPVASWPHSPFRRRFRLLDRSNRLPRSRPVRRLLPLPRTQPLQIRRESTGHASIQKPVWSSSASKSSTLVVCIGAAAMSPSSRSAVGNGPIPLYRQALPSWLDPWTVAPPKLLSELTCSCTSLFPTPRSPASLQCTAKKHAKSAMTSDRARG